MKKILRLLLLPFTLIYVFITEIRNFFFNIGILPSRQPAIPVICVGNLSTGGTGKTPMVEFLVKILGKEFKIATLSRGYGRKTKGFREVQVADSATETGDEPLQIKKKFPEMPVFVDENRLRGIETILTKRPETQVMLMDDAFQHRYVKAGKNIMLTTYQHPFYRDLVLPAGNLRELRRNAQRADVVVVTKCPVTLSESEQMQIRNAIGKYTRAHVFFSFIHYAEPRPVWENGTGWQPGYDHLLLVTGIANPKELLHKASEYSSSVKHLPFADHHVFSAKDIDEIAGIFGSFASGKNAVLTTEKDAVRLRSMSENSLKMLNGLPMFYQPVEFTILDNPNGFRQLVIDYVGKNTGNS